MTTALVGRSTELSMLRAFCRRTEAAGGSLLLRGERGVGKTALLDAISEGAAAEGFCVLRAHAVRAEAETEFSTLNQLLLPLRDWMAQLNTDDQQALSEALGFVESSTRASCAIAASALALLRLTAADHPLLLVVDDGQWVDERSAEALGLLIRSLDGSRTGFLGATRSDDAGRGGPHGLGPGRSFFDSMHVPCTRVMPLDPIAALELITRHCPQLDRREVPGLLARSRGNPLALLELPRVLGASRRDQTPGHAAMSLSRRVQQAFTEDIQALPAETGRLLLLLALEGTGELGLWGAAAGPQLRPAEQAGLVSLDAAARRLTFSHPLVPLTVTALATSDDRRTAHQELSQLLTSWPGRRAPHLAASTPGPDEDVAAELEAAAHIIARGGDPATSVTIYLRSAALSQNQTKRARRLVHAAHLSVTVTGDLISAGNLLQEARRSDPAIHGSLKYAMALSAVALHGRGDADTAHGALVNALSSHLAHHNVDRESMVEAMEGLLDVCLWTQQPEHWSSLCAVLTELNSEEGVVLRLQVAMLADPMRASVDAFERYGTELQQLLTDENPSALVRVAECAVGSDRFSPYRDRLEAVAADGRERGGTVVAIDALCCLAQDALTTGNWDQAWLLAEEGLVWCDWQGDRLRAWTLRSVQALVAAGRGDFRVVSQHTEEMLQWADCHGMRRVRNYACHARALAAVGSGDFDKAYQEATAIAPLGSRPPRGSGVLEAALCMVEAAVRTHRGDAAAKEAKLLRTENNDLSPTRIRLVVAAATAMAASEPARAPLFERALAQHQSARYPFDLARVHLAYGQQLRRSRATSMARAHLRTALDIFERLNARPWVERTKIELDATGETRNQVEPDLSLTPQERTIALLAASGHTNKQIAEKLFLTHRTVAAHLHQVFPKLKVDSRAALRDALDTRTRDPLSLDRFPSQRPINRAGDDRGRAPRHSSVSP